DLRKYEPDPMSHLAPTPQLVEHAGVDALLRTDEPVEIVCPRHGAAHTTPSDAGPNRLHLAKLLVTSDRIGSPAWRSRRSAGASSGSSVGPDRNRPSTTIARSSRR